MRLVVERLALAEVAEETEYLMLRSELLQMLESGFCCFRKGCFQAISQFTA